MERLPPESQTMEETDSLGISALSLEAMSAALSGEGWGVAFALYRKLFKRTCSWEPGGGGGGGGGGGS